MYFNKYPFSQNFQFASGYEPKTHFQFAGETRPVEVKACRPGIFRLTVRGASWDENYSQAELNPEAVEDGQPYQLEITPEGAIHLSNTDGQTLLQSVPRRTFGKCGTASMFRFCHQQEYRYYGAGSKVTGFEHTGLRTKFWNTDVFADFPLEQIVAGRPDPYYVSVPYLIIQTPVGWVGLLYNNPQATFLSIAARLKIESFTQVCTGDEDAILIGAESGQPDLFILAAPTLAALTRQFQQMVGTTPRPPLWALGYQQSRWGYRSVSQLQALREDFEQHGIPVDGLWLDIDYMDGFRVFTADPAENPDFAEEVMALSKAGHPVVPIIDPGVKMDPDYDVYQTGHAQNAFCKNPEGTEFVGLVWPGLTVFPDFSREEVRRWWADQAETFARQG
ncbi:MAG: TIM-barrel domain-containing protein, partial [Puniceicoccales bacterium]